MKKVMINHAPHAIDQPVSILLLALGALLFIATSAYYQSINSQASVVNSQLKKLTQTIENSTYSHLNNSKTEVLGNEKSEERDAINKAIADISLPWRAVFKTIENTDTAYIQLLAIEPNMQKKQVRLTAVAFSKQEMFRYLQDLSQQTMLKNVVLLSQENADVQGESAIHFVVEAIW